MTAEWDTAAYADGHLRAALAEAAAVLERDPRALVDIGEEDLRSAVCCALQSRLPGHVRKERTLELGAFRGVGGFDVLVDRVPERSVAWLAEVKWSYTPRSKIFEAVWDAVKLCLAADGYGVSRCWLITGAPSTQWANTEALALFTGGTVGFRELWTEPLIPPGPNGGKTSGEDLLAGGRGNRFTRAPGAFSVQSVAREDLRSGREDWSIRAVAVHAAGGWLEDFAPAPVFPRIIRQPWLDANVPGMSDELFAELIDWLRQKRWTERELTARVYPLRHWGTVAPREPV